MSARAVKARPSKPSSKASAKIFINEENQIEIYGEERQAHILETLGTQDIGVAVHFMAQACQIMSPLKDLSAPITRAEEINKALQILDGVAPKDELESMLALQMIGVHNLAMECMRKAGLRDQCPEGIEMNVNRATKLMRTYAAQIEALQRYRGKGQQKVTVEHVHVHEGGQAIVGSVTQGGGGSNGN